VGTSGFRRSSSPRSGRPRRDSSQFAVDADSADHAGAIDRLQDKIDRLEKENRRLRRLLTDIPPTDPKAKSRNRLDLPSEEEVDKAMDFVERMIRRFKGVMEDLHKNDGKDKTPGKDADEDGVPL